jgi:radical SAM superfamily enzyme YgiQ (UPF0313 family)
MKVLFIYPNAGSQPGFNYGISHLSAVLKQAGHQVALLQLCEDIDPLPTKEAFIAQIKNEAPDLVGFSVVTNQWPYTRKLAAWVRKATDAPLICGGIHAMAAPEEILKSGLFDYIMRGEAEDALLEFVDKLAKHEEVCGVKNLGFVCDGKIQINPVRALPDLKALPFKDYDVFDFQKLIDAKKGWVGLMGSRGCPFSCSYCFNHKVVKDYRHDLSCSFKGLNYIRHFDVQQIISEIRYLLNSYRNIRMFIFDDDLFTFYKDYVKAFCREYKKASGLPFVVNAHVDFFEKDRAAYLADANCKIVKFGVESGSPRIRRQIMNRHMSNTKIIQAIRTANDSGLHTSVFLMIGLPDETRDDVMATIQLMAKAKPGRYRWSYFFPYPGTKAYQTSVEGRCVDSEKMAQMVNFTDASSLNFGKDHNLFLKKVGRALPWFVNAYSDFEVADFYQKKIADILSMDEGAWEKKTAGIVEEDGEISRRFVSQGLSHYAIKYNRFMGVISDYFVMES